MWIFITVFVNFLTGNKLRSSILSPAAPPLDGFNAIRQKSQLRFGRVVNPLDLGAKRGSGAICQRIITNGRPWQS